jgi:transcriptional regulator with XRE-family HTH domain
MQRNMKVVRTTVIEVQGLGGRIKDARLRDPRPLKEICASIGMSPMNWYRVETEQQSLPEETLREIERALGVSFDVTFSD